MWSMIKEEFVKVINFMIDGRSMTKDMNKSVIKLTSKNKK